MSSDSSAGPMPDDATLPVRLDPACDRFEAAWLSGGRPCLEDFLPLVAEADRAALLRELLALEVEYRGRLGERPTAEEYRGRLPEYGSLIDDAFAAPTAPPDTVPTRPPSPRPASPSLVPGYEILDMLGKGGMGVVYKARQLSLNRTVALKMILDADCAGPEELARFRAEAEALARLRHPNIVQIYQVGASEGRPYFALEYLEGGSLAAKLNGTPLPPAEAARLVETLARAVHAAHQQHVVHRDLKPANVLLAADGTPKITDFGLAKRLDAGEGLSHTGQVMGTPSYMPPEQALGRTREVGPAADVYALGVILYECLTGRPPFKGATGLETLQQVVGQEPAPPHRLRPKTPRDLETVCLKCLEKRPVRRYASALELAEEVRRYSAGEPVRARPVGPLERAWKWARREPSRAVSYVLLAAILLVGVGGGGAVWLWRRAEADKKQIQDLQNQLRWAAYIDDIRYAQQEWDDGRVEEARRYLRECDPAESTPGEHHPERRPWEWDYLDRAYHGATAALPGCTDAAFAPDGDHLVAAGRDGNVRLWDASGGEPAALPGHDGPVNAVSFSPDGDHFASAGEDGTVRVWDAASGKETATLGEDDGPVGVVAFGAGGRLAWAGGDGVVWLADLSGGRGPTALHAAAEGVDLLTFSPDGGRLAAVNRDGAVRLWDAGAARELATLAVQNGLVWGAAFSPDGTLLATAGGDGTVRVWDAATGGAVRVLTGHDGPVSDVAFSPDGACIASAGWDGRVLLWDAATGTPLHGPEGRRGHVNSLAFSPDGGRLVSAGDDAIVRMWDVASGTDLPGLRGHTGPVRRAAFSPDGGRLYSAGDDGMVRVWDTASAKDRVALRGDPTVGSRRAGGVRSAAFSPDGLHLASASVDGTVRVWDAITGKQLRVFRGKAFEAVAYGGDGRLASAGEDGVVRLWDPENEKQPAVRLESGGELEDVAFSPDGGRIATAGADGAVRLWDAASGAPTGALLGHKGAVRSVAFSPDGKRLASAGDDGTVRLWDPAGGKEPATFSGHKGPVLGVAFTPDGRRVASAGMDRTIRLWSADSGEALAVLGGRGARDAPVNGLAFSPDGTRLASAGGDGVVRLWDVDSGKELADLRWHQGPVGRVAFSPDGSRLASAGEDNTVVEWIARERPEQREERHRVWRERQADVARGAGRWFAASFHLSRLIDEHPDDPSLYLERGEAYAAQGLWRKAAADFLRAFDRVSPSD